MRRYCFSTLIGGFSAILLVLNSVAAYAANTSVTKYFDGRDAAMALNYDTELYMAGMIHSNNGWDPHTAASRAQKTVDGWPNIIADCELYGIPVSFNICGHEAVFGDAGISEVNEIDIYQSWHSDSHWTTNTWYSDMPENGGDYKTVGDLSGYTRTYDLIYGGLLTERTMNSDVPFEISYHNFGHESLSNIDAKNMDDTFRLGVAYHKRIGSKLTAECPPWNNNPSSSRYPIYVANGIFVFNRSEGIGSPYEVIEDLWIVPRGGAFNSGTDLTGLIDTVIANGDVLANYSHPEDGFNTSSRSGFQNSLAYARSKVDSGELWATTLSEIGRYFEAKSDADIVTTVIDANIIAVDIELIDYDAQRFGIPYLTFTTDMPNAAPYAKITIDYPSSTVLNSDSNTVRIVDSNVIYSIYLNPNSVTHIEIEGSVTPYTDGVNINLPILSIDSTPPVDARSEELIVIEADSVSTDDIYSANIIYQCNDNAKVSAIMDYNDLGFWETQIGPFELGDSVSYYVSITDNSGRRERSDDKLFNVLIGEDNELPQWRGQGQSVSNPEQGSSLQLFADGKDNVALRYATLATNETGSWEKKMAYGSPMDMGDHNDTWVLSSFTWSNPAIPEGNTVSWRIYYEDASGNEIVTDIMSFTLEAPDYEAPEFFDPCSSSTYAGDSVIFSLRWTDNVALDRYVFSLDNGPGVFVDYPAVDFEPLGGWWDSDWAYKSQITIDNTSSSEAISDYPALIMVDTQSLIAAGKMNPDAGDLRFVSDNNELDFYIESGIDTNSTAIWVNIPYVEASSSKTINMYYGSENHRVSQANGAKTFKFFDNFGGRGWEQYKYVGNPVMGPGSLAGGSGTFSSVLRESETLWRMYSSYDSDGSDIGLSTSSDGINWTHQGVVLRKGTSGEWDASNIWCPAVWMEDDVYYMLYAATGGAGIAMGLASSTDGENFVKYPGNPVFSDPDWAAGNTEGPCFSALKEDGVYYVMYNTLGGHRQSSITSSVNLIDWTRVYDTPRFTGGPSTSDWNYNTFCGNVFKYDDLFYLVIPGQDSSHDYAKFGLYVSPSPAFPVDDTEFKGIVLTGSSTGWEDVDMDTPWVVQFEDKMYMYYAACGSCWSQTGMITVDDIPAALNAAYPPGNYIGTDREASASLAIMPPVGWEKSISGYLEVGSQNFEITLSPAVTGRAVIMYDGNDIEPLALYRDISETQSGAVSAWMRSGNTDTGDYDMRLYGDSGSTVVAAAGLGHNGFFHYWNGSLVDTAVSYSANTWYLVEMSFDSSSDQYNITVYDANYSQLLTIDDISFGAIPVGGIDRLEFNTTESFNGNAYLDDVMVRTTSDVEPNSVIGSELTPSLTESWSTLVEDVNSAPGATVRWKVNAWDRSNNQTESDIYSFITTLPDTAPVVTLIAPQDGNWTDSNTVIFTGICTDDTNVVNVSLYADWNGSWELIDTNSSGNLNGMTVSFTQQIPDGTWTWNFKCTDNTGHESWGALRTLHIDSEPQPWSLPNYTYRSRLIITENSGTDLTNYPVNAVIDTAELIAAGKMQNDCDDVRIFYQGSEIPSQVIHPDSDSTEIWLQIDISASHSEYEVYMYYGNPAASPPDYSAQSSIDWDGAGFVMDSGKITATFDNDGGIISQVSNNSNSTDILNSYTERGLGYLFSENPSVYYIFRVDEFDDTVTLTEDGPIVKIVTAYSGESPQWTQDFVFYNNQDFIDIKATRPQAASSEKYLVGANNITPDGVFSTGDTDELMRTGSSSTDATVTFNNSWQYSATTGNGYVGLVDPSFTNELAIAWDHTSTSDFTWKPRSSASEAGTYSLFIGGNGATNTYGTINTDTFDYRFILRYSASPDNASLQNINNYFLTAPVTVQTGPEEEGTPVVDITPPTITITSPESITYETAAVQLTYSVSEPVSWCGYSIDGEPNVAIVDCSGTTLTGLENGPHEVTVYATDYYGNTGATSVTFDIDIATSPWWDNSWSYRIPIEVNAIDHNRIDEPIEVLTSFTQKFSQLGESELVFDINSVRVVEYSAQGALVGETPSQFDPDGGYSADANALGTVVWIMTGITNANTARYYYIYFDSTDNPKSAPNYVTDLTWNEGIKTLSNTYFDAQLGTKLFSGKYRTGINRLYYNSVEYTDPGISSGAGIYYLASTTAGADSYLNPIDGPIKKTISLTPAANGSLTFTLYDLGQSIKTEGTITDSAFSFSHFPYAHGLSASTLSNQLHYYNNSVIVNETVTTQGWLSEVPDEGWACFDGKYSNKGFALITDSATLAGSNNFWRYYSSQPQLMLPAYNGNPTFPVSPVSWIVMTDTYQDARDFWTKLSAPVSITAGVPESQQPAIEPIISGYILESPGNAPLAGVSVDANVAGVSDVTDANGYYEITVGHNWSGSITATKTGYVIIPNQRDYTNVTANSTDQDFSATAVTYTISGHILDPNNQPVEGVIVDANISGVSDVTDANGYYEITVGYNWSDTLTPVKQDYTFDPNYIAYFDVLDDQPDQDYLAVNIYDLHQDGSINIDDLLVICNNWLTTGPDVPGDIHKDGIVNFLDFAKLAPMLPQIKAMNPKPEPGLW